MLAGCVLVAYLSVTGWPSGWVVCPFKAITGLPCPGCGGLRAAGQLFEGHPLQALYINPLSVLLVLAGFGCALWWGVDKIRGRDTLFVWLRRPWRRWTLVVVVCVLLLNWGWNIYKGL